MIGSGSDLIRCKNYDLSLVAKQLTMGSGASVESNDGAASGTSNSPRTTSGDAPPTGHALTPMRFMPDTAISAWAEALDGCRKYRVYPGHPLDLNARGRAI